MFLLLITIVIYGLAKAVIKMTFSAKSGEEIAPKKLAWNMYFPQIAMLLIAFIIGIYMPQGLSQMLLAAVAGF